MKTGIYQIRNIRNQKLYIGSTTVDFKKRKQEHWNRFINQTHHSYRLRDDWQRYGAGAFIFEILEECPAERCIEREQFYLDTLLFASENDNRFHELGYNIRRIAESNFGNHHSEESKFRIRQSNLGKKRSIATRIKVSQSLIGHKRSRGEKNGRSKLKQKDVDKIRILINQGLNCAQIGRLFHMSRHTISAIKRGEIWQN